MLRQISVSPVAFISFNAAVGSSEPYTNPVSPGPTASIADPRSGARGFGATALGPCRAFSAAWRARSASHSAANRRPSITLLLALSSAARRSARTVLNLPSLASIAVHHPHPLVHLPFPMDTMLFEVFDGTRSGGRTRTGGATTTTVSGAAKRTPVILPLTTTNVVHSIAGSSTRFL